MNSIFEVRNKFRTVLSGTKRSYCCLVLGMYNVQLERNSWHWWHHCLIIAY